MAGKSRPLEATSVATSTSFFPSLKASIAFVRSSWSGKHQNRTPFTGYAVTLAVCRTDTCGSQSDACMTDSELTASPVIQGNRKKAKLAHNLCTISTRVWSQPLSTFPAMDSYCFHTFEQEILVNSINIRLLLSKYQDLCLGKTACISEACPVEVFNTYSHGKN